MFAFAVLVVFLVLAGQYESLTLPLAVVLIVPMCLLAAITGVLLRGQDNNILTQIGLVVLVGLACKNAILIVEFAKQAEDQLGLDRFEAAAHAARLRLRPILMTSFAFILGVVPLVIAEGAGAEARQALGTAVFAGMLGVTVFRPVPHAGVLRRMPPLGAQPPAIDKSRSDRRRRDRCATNRRVAGRRVALMISRFLLAICVALAAASACSVRGTDIEPVAPASAAAFDGAADPALAPAQPVDAWWTTFGDARITTLVEQALSRSPDVREATALVRLARARFREQQGTNWPVGGATAEYEHRRTQALPSDLDLFDAGVDASWEVDIFGARRASITAARLDFARERSLRRLTLVSVAAEVVLAYADVRGTQARLAVARDNVANQESASELTQQLLAAGRGTQLDVDRAIAQLELTRASIPPLIAAESAAIYRLGVLVGSATAGARDRVASSAASAASAGRARDRRAGHIAAPPAGRGSSRIRRTRRRGSGGRGGRGSFPRLVLTGGLGFESYGVGDVDNRGLRFGAGVGVTVPFLEWNRIRQRILAADAAAEIALADYERTALLALEEAERAITGYVQERQRFGHLDLAARAARAAADLARQRFQFGADNFLTVLDAERVRLDAEDLLAQSRLEVTRLAASIFKALGGGWSEAERLTSAQLTDDDAARLRRVLKVER